MSCYDIKKRVVEGVFRMERLYLTEVLDGLLGESSETYREEMIRRGFSEYETDVAKSNWNQFRMGVVGSGNEAGERKE